MCDINKLEKKLRYTREPGKEKHYHHGCYYKVLKNCTIKECNKLGKVTILIRICKCGYYNDRSKLQEKKEFKLDELLDSGVKIHIQ